MVASLIDHPDGVWEGKRRTLQVDGTPTAGGNVAVVSLADKRCRQEVRSTRALKIPQGKPDVGLREVYQPVAAKDEIGGGEALVNDVAAKESATRRRPTLSIRCDERGHNVDANVTLDRVRDRFGPIEVATRRVQQS